MNYEDCHNIENTEDNVKKQNANYKCISIETVLKYY
jgi:hypothetical protein